MKIVKNTKKNNNAFIDISIGRILVFTCTCLVVFNCSTRNDLEEIGNKLPVNGEPPIDKGAPLGNNTPIDDKPVDNNPITLNNSNTDINLMLPQDWVVLNNFFEGPSNLVSVMEWKKISGPESYKFGYSNSNYALIDGLIEGKYEFELTVNYTNGNYSQVKANVNVYDVHIIPENTSEIIIENLNWIFPWYANLEISNFYKRIPSESLFRIFVKRDSNVNWEEVPGSPIEGSLTSPYDYFIERRFPDGAGMYTNGSLFINYYGNNTTDTPAVKIVYW